MYFSKKKTRQFLVYALIDGESVFIGKTQGNIEPVYYRHRRAENVYTSHYYYPPNSKEPKIYILEKKFVTFEEVEHHITAWIYIFLSEGYQVINSKNDLDQVNDLSNKLKTLINKLWPASFEFLLEDGKCNLPKSETAPRYTATTPGAHSSQQGKRQKITIWASLADRKRFIEYAKELKLTQSQTLHYMMSKVELEKEDPLFPNWDDDIFVRNLREGYECEIAKRDEIIHKLQLTLGKYKEERGREARKRRQSYELVKNAVTVLYKFCCSTAPIPLDVERGMHKKYIDQLSNKNQYQYPASSGASFVRMHAVLLGEGNAPARFVLGTDERGQGIKLRFYPSNYFVGVNPGNVQFAKRNSVWYLSWRKNGEVAELIAALPMQIQLKYHDPMDEIEIMHAHADRLVEESDKIDNLLKILRTVQERDF